MSTERATTSTGGMDASGINLEESVNHGVHGDHGVGADMPIHNAEITSLRFGIGQAQ